MTYKVEKYDRIIGDGPEWVVVSLEGVIKSICRTDDAELETFKAAQLQEIQQHTQDINAVEGIELLKPAQVEGEYI